MGFKAILQISMLPLLILLSISSFSIAADPVALESRVLEAQNSLNVQGFTPTASLGMEFSDSIDPYTGALTVTQTDVSIPGRNGMNIKLTRTYSSNIFSNINQYHSAALACGEKNKLACDHQDKYVTCLTPDTISGRVLDSDGIAQESSLPIDRPMTLCDSGSNVYSESSSYNEPKMFGLGWDMAPGKLKDPTPLLYQKINGINSLTYAYISARGVTSQGMTIDNNEQPLILPSQYSAPTELQTANPAYGINYQWSNRLGDPNGDITAYRPSDMITQAQNTHASTVKMQTYTAYTSSLSPIFMKFPTLIDMALNGPGSVLNTRQATYYSKEGRTYFFTHNVPFCGKFDDMKSRNVITNRDDYCQAIPDRDRSDVFNWAQNPYAGVYLTGAKDKFGNQIAYNYYTAGSGLSAEGTPFINTITGGASSQYVKFHYADKTGYPVTNSPSLMDLTTRVEGIEYNSPTSSAQKLYVQYTYASQRETFVSSHVDAGACDSAKLSYMATHDGAYECVSNYGFGYSIYKVDAVPLLSEVKLLDGIGGNVIAGTTYKYEYNNAKELVKVTLPHGAIIEYEYAWAPNVPSYDLLRQYDSSNADFQKIARRVVVKKSVTNGGSCPSKTLPGGVASGNSGGYGSCVWVYQYKPVSKTENIGGVNYQHYELETSIHDPFGGKQVYKMLPATYSSLNYR
ncbi:hypothetical protein HY989_04035 [Candidatus Micrarchaeota archaeon]|nr:hypothetical protein [Candidatus Micrarchaeota archaeon]